MLVVEQDGAHTDRRVPPAGWPARFTSMHPRTKIALRTLLVADIGLLLAFGALFALFMERPAGLVAAGCCWGLAALLMNASRVARWLARRRHS
jgi:hypothetical protein